MKPLPAGEVLATMVSNVTQTMLGISFVASQGEPPDALKWKTAVLPIPGSRPITVGLSSDEPSCTALSAAMFAVAHAEVDSTMVDDSLRELLNMTAGLVKSNLSLDQALGLPTIRPAGVEHPKVSAPGGAGVVLKAKSLGLFLWICEGIITN